MARPTRSSRNSASRASYPFETEPAATESGTQAGQAMYDNSPADAPMAELDRSTRTRRRTTRITTHAEEQAKSHKRSDKIQRTKARNRKKAARVSKKGGSGSLSNALDDEDGDKDSDDEDYNENQGEEVLSDDEPNESIDGLDDEDTSAQQEAVHDDDMAEPVDRQDTDLDANSSERERLLLRLYEATGKDFSTLDISGLHALSRAHCEDQEASDAVVVESPSIERLDEYHVAPGGGYKPTPSATPQPERSKRALVEPVSTASKRTRLAADPSTNPSLVEPPSSQTAPIPPPSFATRPVQPANPSVPSVPSSHPLNRGPPLRAQHAPSPSLNPGGVPSRAQLTALGPRSSGSTAPTVLDDPPHQATPTPPRSLPPPRSARPIHPRVTQPIPRRAPTSTAVAPRAPASTSTAPRAMFTSAAPPIAATRAQIRTIPRESTPVPGTSTGTSRWVTFDNDELEPLPEPISQPQHRSTPRANAPSSSRTAHAPSGMTRFNIDVGASAPPRAGARAAAGSDRFSRDLGGPAPGVPPRMRPYIPHTDLVHDRAEEFAAADAQANGRRVTSGRKPKPHARNYNGDERMMVPFTAKRHFGFMLVDNPYGNRIYSRQTAKDAYEEEWANLLPHKELRLPNDDYFNLLVNRGATSRGDARNRIRPIAQNSGGFIHPARTPADFQFNMARVAALLPNRFHYGSLDPPARPYGNIDISRALGAALFHSATSVGAVHRDLFGPLMPLQTIAFVLTNFHVCVSEFTTGRYDAVDLNVAAQYQLYLNFCRGLEAYAQRAPSGMARMQKDWYKYAMAFAGIDDDEEGPAQDPHYEMIPLEHIPLDEPEPEMEEALEPPADPETLESPALEFDATENDQIRVDADGWQEYSHDDLYGDYEDTPTEQEPELEQVEDFEPEPEPEIEYTDAGRLSAHAKGKGRAAPGPSRRTRR